MVAFTRILIVCVVATLLYLISSFLSNQLRKEGDRMIKLEKERNSYVGEDIVLGEDTLTIIRYFPDPDMYKLSNDQVVPPMVVEKKILD